MSTRERPVDRAERHVRRSLLAIGEEVRTARLDAGLGQQDVARAMGVSRPTMSRIERGQLPHASVRELALACSALGLDLAVRAYPDRDPVRDAGHRRALARLRARLHPSLVWRTEVPLPIPGDRRAWDAHIRGPDFTIGVEAEMRPSDGQALGRRLALKERDGQVDHVLLLLPDTRDNRRRVDAIREALGARFERETRQLLASLGRGTDPGGSGIVIL